MKTKYKIGNLIQHDNGKRDVIDGILITENKLQYRIESGEFVFEEDVTAVFRPVTPRKTQQKRPTSAKGSKKPVAAKNAQERSETAAA